VDAVGDLGVVAPVRVQEVPGHFQAGLGTGEGQAGGVVLDGALVNGVSHVDDLRLSPVLVGGFYVSFGGVHRLVSGGLELQSVFFDQELHARGNQAGGLVDVLFADGFGKIFGGVRLEADHLGPVVGGDFVAGGGEADGYNGGNHNQDSHGITFRGACRRSAPGRRP
jgi:hypothetical protein